MNTEDIKVCAGIVLYNPDLYRLSENICSIIDQVSEVILIDNSSANVKEIHEFLVKLPYSVKYIRNEQNGGIAKALNQILDFSEQQGYDFFLTMDQDSVCNAGLIDIYKQIDLNNVAQITCRIIDRDNGEVDATLFEGHKYIEVDYCITSGCINMTSALRQVGGYDEQLFIDGLDISLRLKKSGYKILKVNFEGLTHELGEKSGKSKLIKTSSHTPWRNYYTRRNLIYVARKYYTGIQKHKRILLQIAYGLGAIVLEDKKRERIKYNFKGIVDGLKKPV